MSSTCLMTRLGDVMRERRAELDMSQEDLASAAGLSVKTVSRIELDEGHEPELRTMRKIERALQWAAGTIERLINGDDEVPVELSGVGAKAPDDLQEIWASATADERARLLAVIDEMRARRRKE